MNNRDDRGNKQKDVREPITTPILTRFIFQEDSAVLARHVWRFTASRSTSASALSLQFRHKIVKVGGRRKFLGGMGTGGVDIKPPSTKSTFYYGLITKSLRG
ncbi:hypothetical protein MTP99_000425 [Tenebrio molitor]|nr:hypothetical protein MTP99_000425 [Tenebrio molitor]